MNENKLYISDLDGTLLADNALLSDHSLTTLTDMICDGLNFTIASARSTMSMKQVVRNLPLNLPVIEINGAMISDINTGEHFIIHSLKKSIVHQLHEIITSHGCCPFIASYDGDNDKFHYEKLINEGMEWFLNDASENHTRKLNQTSDITSVFDEMVVCLAVIGNRQQVHNICEEIELKFPEKLENHFFANPYTPQWQWLTIHQQNANKNIAVKKLAEILEYRLDNVVVFGDNLNDVDMMKLNQLGAHTVAMDNATDEVKKYASEIIGGNGEDAVVNYIANSS